MTVFIFLAPGFEETEAIATIDILKRADLDVVSVSVSIADDDIVTGAHGISILADQLFEETDFSEADMLVLPGGMPGTINLRTHEGLRSLLLRHHSEGKRIAAICAAPSVLGDLGLLEGKRATVYPGFEKFLKGAEIIDEPVVIDGNIITAKGPGMVFDFGLTIAAELSGQEKADEVAAGMII
jgi:4-methyl-5(b-hydroxyethyl)-thiazole monophosphate biosynthesis